jgi:phosphonate transport system substrate-binding protein
MNNMYKSLIVILVMSTLLVGCGKGRQQVPDQMEPIWTATMLPPEKPTDLPDPTNTPTEPPTEVPAEVPTETSIPTITPTLPPLGEEGNPIVWAMPEGADNAMFTPALEAALEAMRERTGLAIEAAVFPEREWNQMVEDMCSGKAHIAVLDAFRYIWANERGCADAYLSPELFGGSVYQSQILVRNDSGIESLADLAGSKFCRLPATSKSGWIVPTLMLKAEGLDPDTLFGEIVDVDTHGEVVEGIYNGVCDAGATFIDARTALEGEWADVRNVAIRLDESIQIPQASISFSRNLSEEMRNLLIDSLYYLATLNGGKIIEDMYGWQGFFDRQDYLFDPLRTLITAAGVEVETLIP